MKARRTSVAVVVAVAAGLLLAACSALPVGPSPVATSSPLPTTTPVARPTTAAATATLQEPDMTPTSRGTGDAEGAVLPPAIASVLVADLAQRLGMSREGVRILSSERVEMPAGSLGCGDQPGQGNDLVAGLEVRAQAGDAIYVYRTDRRRLIPCSPNIPGNTGPIYLGIPSATPAVRPPDAAVADLAARLSVAASEIRVVSVEAVQWPDASMGCPRPGMAYAQVITPGYRVVLEAGGRTYAYHGAEGRIFLCTR